MDDNTYYFINIDNTYFYLILNTIITELLKINLLLADMNVVKVKKEEKFFK